jgi:hypothetical protein
MTHLVQELSNHTGTLLTLIGVAWGLTGFLFWRLITGLEAKVDLANQCLKALAKGCGDRRDDCNKDFVGKVEFTEWKKGRDDPGGLWHAINHHDHDDKGRVIKT